MSIGKDSIQKRVAKPQQGDATEKKVTAPKAVPKAAPKKAPTKTLVVTKIAPEVVEKVTGHSEKADVEKVSVGSELPYFLL